MASNSTSASDLVECGYQGDFLEVPPDYLRCQKCHMVLKNPVVLMECGHYYGGGCFEKLKGEGDFICPIDKKVVDINKVVEDSTKARLVGELKVKCPFSMNGCTSDVDLERLKAHAKDCTYNMEKVHTRLDGISFISLLNANKAEGGIKSLKEDVDNLKWLITEVANLKKALEFKDSETDALKVEISELKEQMEEMKKNAVKPGENGPIANIPNNHVTLAGAVAVDNKQTFVWKSNIVEWEVGDYTYSRRFNCHKDGYEWRLCFYLQSDKQLKLYLDSQRGDHGEPQYDVNVELTKDDGSNMRETVCSKEILYEHERGYTQLSKLSESKYQPFIFNNVLKIIFTWICQH